MPGKPLIYSNLIAAKSLGFTNTILNLSKEERSSTPSGTYGRDYNRLRTLTVTNFPELTDFLPPSVLFYGDESEFCGQTYSEIYSFCEQIYQIISSFKKDNNLT